MMEEKNKIDQLFSQGLSDPEIPFNDLDWEKMEAKLDQQHKKKTVPLWLIGASGIAAAIVIIMFFILSDSNTKPIILKQQSSVKTPVKSDTTSSANHQLPVNPKSPKLTVQKTSILAVKNPIIKNAIFHKQDAVNSFDKLENYIQNTHVSPIATLQINTDSLMHEAIAKIKAKTLADSNKVAISELDKIRKDIVQKTDYGLRPNAALTMSIIAAPDISTTKMSRPSKLSSNFGLVATYAISARLSVTSGVVYSKKLYNYRGMPLNNTINPTNTWDVNANCDVLDIPLNVNYKLFHKNKFAISINAGASSYVMLKERYQFIYSGASQWKNVKNLVLNNENQYLFGVANLGVSINREISPGLSIGIQPFMKLPLTGIGYGDTRLKSTGVSFSLNLGIFPRDK